MPPDRRVLESSLCPLCIQLLAGSPPDHAARCRYTCRLREMNCLFQTVACKNFCNLVCRCVLVGARSTDFSLLAAAVVEFPKHKSLDSHAEAMAAEHRRT
jgi:hypothetical protein